MARSDLGTKRLCPTTGKKFYDLNKDPVVSPYTGEVVPTAVSVASSRVAAPVVSRKAPVEDEEEDAEGPELVSLDEVEAEENDKDTDVETEGDEALEADDGGTVDDDTLVVDEDDDDTTDLVDVENDEDDS